MVSKEQTKSRYHKGIHNHHKRHKTFFLQILTKNEFANIENFHLALFLC